MMNLEVTETEKSVFLDGLRLWYNKQSGAIRLKVSGVKELHYVKKGYELYEPLLQEVKRVSDKDR
ncbi:hypothetical protein GLW07_02235 [Bacillus hwajinpoensis]|uniref:Uncharacterized protein n=1 Tax=Guptibacillus hwajinpoensis TaxID=208199 RepID=A0A845ERW2_9BACL|nr:hypothetical protein [Pseudalkalibacillus hwajinpoensis]MYL62167.1 hypothetical protein [Pseudalkalibacillus hwajinpoensis]